MASFRNINISGLADSIGANQSRLRVLSRFDAAPATGGAAAAKSRLAAGSDEAATRTLLQTYLEDAGNEFLLDITSPDRPELVPDMRAEGAGAAPDLNSRSVTYQQASDAIPIFGSRVVVDIDGDEKTLMAINGKVTPRPDISPLATISPAEALVRLTRWGGRQAGSLTTSPPILTWYLDEDTEAWRLVHHFAAAPMSPPADGPIDAASHHGRHVCTGRSPRSDAAAYDYFVDAHSGEVVFYFSSAPRLDIPAPMKGLDALNTNQDFWGLQGTGFFALIDPIRNIETFDYQYSDLDAQPQPPLPASAIRHPTNDLGNSAKAAVSAHFNAKQVFDFYNDVLKRDGIDDRGMKLVSVVNVYSSVQNPLPAPQWGNAVWWQNKMWYGEENGVSFAKYLDIIAHELTHGVTATSSNLIYRRLPGALNESYSDVFGVIIANWYPAAPNPVSMWNWEIGPGLGAGGTPIRNFADPALAGQPDHMNQYVVLPLSQDEGGVHIYSGIHNKAVHGLLTNVDAAGHLTFPTVEAVLMLYLTLTRLTPTSDFRDSRRTLENVVGVYHASDPATRAARLAAVAAAFDAVGIV